MNTAQTLHSRLGPHTTWYEIAHLCTAHRGHYMSRDDLTHIDTRRGRGITGDEGFYFRDGSLLIANGPRENPEIMSSDFHELPPRSEAYYRKHPRERPERERIRSGSTDGSILAIVHLGGGRTAIVDMGS